MKRITISVDGPAGSGKSTIAKSIAKKYDLTYVDTGAMYRALTYKAIENDISVQDTQEIIKLVNKTKIELIKDRVFLDGNDVSNYIRSAEVSNLVSTVSSYPEVRNYMAELQRKMGEKGNVIMDGRDIGTVILPNATLKFFLTASIEERAKRRFLELKAKGENVDFNTILNDIEKRDITDSTRKIAPLTIPKDGIIIDSTKYNIDEVLSIISEYIDNIKEN